MPREGLAAEGVLEPVSRDLARLVLHERVEQLAIERDLPVAVRAGDDADSVPDTALPVGVPFTVSGSQKDVQPSMHSTLPAAVSWSEA